MYKQVMVDGVAHYGKHLMCRVIGCHESVLDTEEIKKFMSDLVPAIGMKAYGEPQAFRFGDGDEVGISGFQLIYTSNIAIHTNDAARELYFDLFSCKDFSTKTITDFLRIFFGGVVVDVNEVYRA